MNKNTIKTRLGYMWDTICLLGILMSVACIETSVMLAFIGLIPLGISALVHCYNERRYCK